MQHICCFRPTVRNYKILQYKMLRISDLCDGLGISCTQTDGRTDVTRLTVPLRNVSPARLKLVFEDGVQRFGPVVTVTSYGVLS